MHNQVLILEKLFKNRFFEQINIDEHIENINLQVLIEKKKVIKENNQIHINYNLKSNRLFKEYIDQCKFEELDQKLQNEILYIKSLLFKVNKNKIFSIFLIGSIARNTHNVRSDIDLLILHSGEKIKLPEIKNKLYNTQFITHNTKDLFLNGVINDEIFIWALKYGLLLYDRNFIFSKIQSIKSLDYFQVTIKKREQIDYMCTVFESILKSDYDNYQHLLKTLMKILNLMSRYILLLYGEFPLSRPELKQQVMRYNQDIGHFYNYLSNQDLQTSQLINIYYSMKKFFIDLKIMN